MKQSANDWASPDPSKNMTLAEADQLNNQLAGALCLQIGSRWVQTQYGQIITDTELRQNTFIAPLPVNLYGMLAIPGCQGFNLADFRKSLRTLAEADDPTGSLVIFLQQLLPQYNGIPAMFTRIPAVQAVITAALKTI
jgi:hypothetical protein